MTRIDRETAETAVRVEFTRRGECRVATTERFLDHMLTAFGRHGRFGLAVEAKGDLRHHLIEDVAIALGQAVAAAVDGPIARFGHQVIPMDDALVECSLDLGGRPYYRGPLPSPLYDHWMRSFADNAGATLHIRVLRGRDRHHVVEAAFKALGRALAEGLDPRDAELSTKGPVRVTR